MLANKDQEDSTSLKLRKDGHHEMEPFIDFDLSDDEYGSMTFARRIDPGGPSSPSILPHQISKPDSIPRRRQSTLDASEGGLAPLNWSHGCLLT